MNADQLAIDGLAAQEMESLASCVARGQTPDSYADIVAKLRGHCEKLPESRQQHWDVECKVIGVTLFPPALSVAAPTIVEKPAQKPKAK